MENKEVEDALFYMSEKARREPYTDPLLIMNYYHGIEEYIESLEQQLQAKDKALDKACEQLEIFDQQFNKDNYADQFNKQEWKERFENGID